MSDFCRLWPDGPEFRQSPHFPLGTDSVLLADFARISQYRLGADLGCGSGAISLLLLCLDARVSMTGVELLPEAADIARENMARNGLADRCRIMTGDIRNYKTDFPAGCFDFAVSNPPYFTAGSGYLPSDAGRASARAEDTCSLAELCSAAAYLVRTGGAFFMVHRPERLSEIFCAMSARGIEPKRLRMVQHAAGTAPNLVLIEGRRGGRPGLKIEAPLILREGDGESAEARRIYHLDTEARHRYER